MPPWKTRPVRRNVSASARLSAMVFVQGFSQYTSLPARAAYIESIAWLLEPVVMSTASRSSRASSSRKSRYSTQSWLPYRCRPSSWSARGDRPARRRRPRTARPAGRGTLPARRSRGRRCRSRPGECGRWHRVARRGQHVPGNHQGRSHRAAVFRKSRRFMDCSLHKGRDVVRCITTSSLCCCRLFVTCARHLNPCQQDSYGSLSVRKGLAGRPVLSKRVGVGLFASDLNGQSLDDFLFSLGLRGASWSGSRWRKSAFTASYLASLARFFHSCGSVA